MSEGKELVQGARRSVAPKPAKSDARPIVVVIGMHRSGTSLCSHLLSVLGIDMATDIVATEANKKGHWERLEIMEFQDRILKLFNRDYYGPYHDFALPAGWWADPRVRAIAREIEAFLEARLTESAFVGFKDPRTARLLPMWAQVFSKLNLSPRYIFCLRHPGDVAQSLNQRDGLEHDVGEFRSLVYLFDILKNIEPGSFCAIEYESWFEDPLSNIDKMCDFIGFKPAIGDLEIAVAAGQIIAPDLNHAGKKGAARRGFVSEQMYSQIKGFLAGKSNPDSLARLVHGFSMLQTMVAPFEQRIGESVDAVAKKATELEAARAENAEFNRRIGELTAALGAKDEECQRNARELALVAEAKKNATEAIKAEYQRLIDEKARALEACQAELRATNAMQVNLARQNGDLATHIRGFEEEGRVGALRRAFLGPAKG